MRFYGAIRGEPGKAVSDDAFACPAQPVLFCNQRHILPKPLRCKGKNVPKSLNFSQVGLSRFGAIFCG
jgi:hypothetical protein